MTTFEGHEGSKKKTKVKCQAGRQCCSRERSVGQKQTLVMYILVWMSLRYVWWYLTDFSKN